MDAPRTTATSKRILYCRLPGLLSLAARRSCPDLHLLSPLIVSEGRLVRDACAVSSAQGVRAGMTVIHARRLCPTLLAAPLEAVDAREEQTAFLDVLADLSPIVNPDGLDVAYTDLTGGQANGEDARIRLVATLGLIPIVGLGASRLAARACAESGVERLEDATVEHLWPDDPAVIGRLQRLGLTSFGAVTAVPEESLRLHFGKIAPLLHGRAYGTDLTPVRALYPPPSADVMIDCSESPVDDKEQLAQVVARASQRAERQLQGLGVGRRLILEVRTERGEFRQEWAVPMPLERASDIRRDAWRLLCLMRLAAPVTRLRLCVEDVAVPNAHTADLFNPRTEAVSLEATRRRLAARFGLMTLKILGQMPRAAREKRRAAMQERDTAMRKMLL